MKNKGFTLIELLAVIVILAIIALIATPIILNIINESKAESKLRSAENYLTAVEQAIIKENMEREFNPSSCVVQANGNLICDGETEELVVDVKGEKPEAGAVIKFKNSKVTELTHFVISGTPITLTNGKLKINKSTSGGNTTPSYKEYVVGEEVYYDVENGTSCTKEKYEEAGLYVSGYIESDDNCTYNPDCEFMYGEKSEICKSCDTIAVYSSNNSNSGYNGIDNRTGTQNSCLKFYAIKDNGDKVDMILDHKASGTLDCVANTYDTAFPGCLLIALNESTKNWNNTETPESYNTTRFAYDILGQEAEDYTINYGTLGMKARLITAEEVASIVGTTFEHQNINFEENNLFDTWTATGTRTWMNYWYASTNSLGDYNPGYGDSIKPVITVSKANLK